MDSIGQVKGDHTFQWMVEKFSFAQSGRDEYEYYSPEFSFAGALWRIRLYIYIYGDDPDCDAYLFIVRTSTGLPISLNISFKSDGEFNTISNSTQGVFNERGTEHGILFIKQYDLYEVRVSIFPITVNLKYLASSENPNGDCMCITKSFCHENKLIYDIKQSFFEGEDCDVLLKVKGREFRTHKFILKSRSPVFASTLRSEVKKEAICTLQSEVKKEAISNLQFLSVDITDCDPSSFEDFLYFLYSGEVATLSKDNAYSLFVTANKYDVQDLRSKCLVYIKGNLSIESFCDTLALAHLEPELNDLTTSFFIKNAPKIILTPEWQSFLPDNSAKCNELLIKLLGGDKNSSE